jgi:hypothetical protein
VPVAAHRGFFRPELTLGAGLSVFRGRQGGEVNIQPEPIISKGVTEGAAFPSKQNLTPLAQLCDLLGREAIQGACEGRLFGKALAAPGMGQGQIWPQPGVHLSNGTASHQNADENIEQFARRRVDYSLQWQPHTLEHGFKKVRPRQTVAKHTQRCKVSLFRHGGQAYGGAHWLPPSSMIGELHPTAPTPEDEEHLLPPEFCAKLGCHTTSSLSENSKPLIFRPTMHGF